MRTSRVPLPWGPTKPAKLFVCANSPNKRENKKNPKNRRNRAFFTRFLREKHAGSAPREFQLSAYYFFHLKWKSASNLRVLLSDLTREFSAKPIKYVKMPKNCIFSKRKIKKNVWNISIVWRCIKKMACLIFCFTHHGPRWAISAEKWRFAPFFGRNWLPGPMMGETKNQACETRQTMQNTIPSVHPFKFDHYVADYITFY